jgi:biopolymer transport protein ExbB/TolQ
MERIAEFFHAGGLFMYLNLGIAIIALAIIVDRAVFMIRSGSLNANVMLDMIRKLLISKRLDRAIKLVSRSAAPLLVVAKTALTKVTKGDEAVAAAVEEVLVEVTPNIKKRISSLWALANVATLLGLIGTIQGLIASFAAVGTAAAEERSQKLAAGISEAMNNTWLGLVIAVACIVGHLVLGNMAKKKVSELEMFAIKIENMLSEEWVAAAVSGPAPADEESK